jgi:hypothetical protein
MIAAESVCYACQEDSLTASSEAVFDALAVEKNLDGPHAKGVQDLVVNVLAAGPDQKMG